jgi:hypothetical protein
VADLQTLIMLGITIQNRHALCLPTSISLGNLFDGGGDGDATADGIKSVVS